jgi:hypothetical protein
VGWLRKLFGISNKSNLSYGISDEFNRQMRDIKSAGAVGNRHYTDCVETVKQLKREGRNREAISLLLKCVNATEAESKRAGKGWGVAPWYYEQLAILYRKEKDFSKEVEILERYDRQKKALGAKPAKLSERLIKARALTEKHKA